MIQVTEVILDPDFAQDITVTRTTAKWEAGRFTPQQEQILTLRGTVTVATSRDLEQLPEGDRQKGMMCFHVQQELFVTARNEGHEGPSDKITWRGRKYFLVQVFPELDYGYCKAIGAQEEAE